MGKLDVSPIKVGFIPLAAYDSQDDKIYVGIKIDRAGTLEELRSLLGKALGFAVNVGYTSKETISYFISKAVREEKALEKLLGEEKKEEPEEKKAEEEKSEKVKGEKQNEDSGKKDAKEEA